MNNNIKIFSIAIIVIFIIGAGYFFTKEEKTKEDVVAIRMLDSSTTKNSWEILKKLTGRDILEEEGVKLELITSVQSTGGTTNLQALIANNIDYSGQSNTLAWINAIAAGGKIKAVVPSTNPPSTKDNPGAGLVVLENSSIFAAKDLIGKKIAVNILGASADFNIRTYLKKNGFSIEQVQLVVVPSAQIEQVLRSGQVDAGSISEENFGVAMERGGLRQLPGTTVYDLRGSLAGVGSGFRNDFIKEHPETVKRFIIAYEKSQRLVWEEYQKDPERVKKAVAEVLTEKGGNPKIAKYFTPSYDPEHPYATDEDVQIYIDFLESDGKLKPGQIKPSDVYTHEYNPFYKEYIQKKGGK